MALWVTCTDAEVGARGKVFSGPVPDEVRLRLGRGFTRRRAGNSGTSKIGDGVPRYMVLCDGFALLFEPYCVQWDISVGCVIWRGLEAVTRMMFGSSSQL